MQLCVIYMLVILLNHGFTPSLVFLKVFLYLLDETVKQIILEVV